MGTVLNVGAVQQGLSDLGGALARNNAILAQQQASTAKLKVRQKLSDKINEFSQRQTFEGDWGLELRDFTHQAIGEVSGDIKDPQVLAAFETEMMNQTESQVNTYREIQATKQTEAIHSNLEAAAQQGITQASSDPETFLAGVHANLFSPATGKFTPAALQAYGGPEGARNRTQQVVDAGAGAYVGAQIDKIMNDGKSSWSMKFKALEDAQAGLLAVFDAYDLPPSQATRAKLEDAIAKATSQASTAAVKEHKDQGMAQLASVVSNISPAWAGAKLAGRAFDPQVYLKPLLDDPNLDVDVREAANTKLKDLTLEADKGLSTEATSKALKTNLDTYKNRIQVLLQQGANTDYLEGKIVEWVKQGGAAGGLDMANYSEAVAFAKAGVGLESDPVIKSTMETAFKDFPADAKAGLMVRFKELAGGLYNKGEPDAFKTNGRWDQTKLRAAAADMAQAQKDDALKQILSMDFHPDTVVYNEMVEYVKRAGSGKLIGQFDAGNVATRSAPFTDALFLNLKTNQSGIPKDTPTVEFNMYTSAGLPTFVWPDGTKATPTAKDGKVEWSLTGGRYGRR